MKRLISAVLILTLIAVLLCGCSESEQIEFNYFTGKFDPFTVRSVQDMSVVDLVNETLFVTSGDEQASPVYDAHEKGLGIADIDIDYENDKSICTVTIGDDVYFSDGVQLTAKDVAFSMYVYASLDYDGWSSFNTSALEGLTDYQYGNSTADETVITDEQIKAELENPSDITKQRIREFIILPVLKEEYKWISAVYKDPAFKGTEVEKHMELYPKATELFAFYYSIDTSYTGKGDSDEECINKIADLYGYDYKTLGDVYGSDLSELAKNIAKRTLTEKALEGKEKDVNSISGIERIDDFTLRITINSVDTEEIEKVLGIYVAPCHYYGGENADSNWGDGLSNSFEADFEAIAKKSSSPIGAGRYTVSDYNAGKNVVFAENKNYFRDIELEKNLSFVETGDSTKIGNNGYLITNDNRLYVEK